MDRHHSTKEIARGTFIILIGTFAGLFLTFLTRLLIARNWNESEFGIFSLAIVILNICAILSTLGMQNGASRMIAYTKGRNDIKKINIIFILSLSITLLSSLLTSVIIFISSETIAEHIFQNSDLIIPLKIFSTIIPFIALINILVSIYLGFGNAYSRLYFQFVIQNFIFILIIIIIIVYHAPFVYIFYAYALSIVLTCFLFVIYTLKFSNLPVTFNFIPIADIWMNSKELLSFSLPLLGVTLLQTITGWTDTLMLGYFRNTAMVGLYNAAIPIAQLISLPMNALLLIYTPITSKLYAQNLTSDIQKNYVILTKWIFLSTLPLFLTIFLFADVILHCLFGEGYIGAAKSLQILSLGFIIVNLLGPNGSTLIALGDTKFLMLAGTIAASINIAMNFILVPVWGADGAAISTASSISIYCIIRHMRVHSYIKISSLNNKFLLTTTIYILFMYVLYNLIYIIADLPYLAVIVFFILTYFFYFLFIFFSKSYDKEDLEMCLAVKKKISNFFHSKN